MPFDAILLGNVEDALSECFNYHSALDSFLIRGGLKTTDLIKARALATERVKHSSRGYAKSPKRFVVQEVLSIISNSGASGDLLIAEFVTNLLKGKFPDASDKALSAIESIRAQIVTDKAEKLQKREEAEYELRKQQQTEDYVRQQKCIQLQRERDGLNVRFLNLCEEANPQQRGYLLERFLHDLFALEGFDPKASFKIVGEQIDGSFQWNGHVHLVEAKWVKEPVAGAEFGAFMYKLTGKSVDTRGLYISINGYSPEAIKGLTAKGDLRFVCLDGAHIMRCLGAGQSLERILDSVWRHASETGGAYWAVSCMD